MFHNVSINENFIIVIFLYVCNCTFLSLKQNGEDLEIYKVSRLCRLAKNSKDLQ